MVKPRVAPLPSAVLNMARDQRRIESAKGHPPRSDVAQPDELTEVQKQELAEWRSSPERLKLLKGGE